MTADYCTPIPDGFICGTRMREHSRRSGDLFPGWTREWEES